MAYVRVRSRLRLASTIVSTIRKHNAVYFSNYNDHATDFFKGDCFFCLESIV